MTRRTDLAKLRALLKFIAEQAVQAQGMTPDDDTLLDLVDAIDNDVQAVIVIINRARGNEVGGDA